MVTFIVPVKSKVITSDWEKFSHLLERTLKSICNQRDSNFKVVVVCHEIPEIRYTHPNLNFLPVDFEPPNINDFRDPKESYREKEIDKGKKIFLGAKYASKEFNTDFIMTVDSDDYISRNIATFVNKNARNVSGWFIRNGYIHFDGKRFLVKTTKFNHLCGSSIIIKPELVNHFIGMDETFYFDHRLTTLDSNIELQEVPFPAAIYSVGNGENIYMSLQNVRKFNDHGNWISMQSLKRLYYKFRNYRIRIITSKLRKEFNFYPVTDQEINRQGIESA